ncbi:2-oxoadipate dioxygenase/decarboxylase family protein [Hahella ganghwensis]|uniref:2-oxoadipate dioxygenase/decarboxylase family protein n=1 Tax=Hahella ganghwensis TaxID=286420 RepID=UPI00037EDE72|nr:DUF1338 family protein [Hahella ganghwensis]
MHAEEVSGNSTNQLLESTLGQLLSSVRTADQVEELLTSVAHNPALLNSSEEGQIPRSMIAHAMNLLLLQDLLQRVPEGQTYVREKIIAGGKVVFDHGALRTVRWENQALPSGYKAFSRLLEPLGFELAGEYPLNKLNMCGFVYCHQDFPESIAQFFVSELYPEEFSEPFQAAVDRTVSTSVDPLTPGHLALLHKLSVNGWLSLGEAAELLPAIVACFDRQHAEPYRDDYLTLLKESAEMAWISTEGNAFNHGTDRVDDLKKLDAEQRTLGRPMKPEIEVAQNANILQTAYRATMVKRQFKTAEGLETFEVPGSFFEFIQRNHLDSKPEESKMDLRFDSRNAQGIFKMTRKH